MVLLHQTVLTPLSILGCILSSILYSSFPSLSSFSSLQVSAAPIPPLLTRQPPHTYNHTFFPYTISGPVPPPVHPAGAVLDTCKGSHSYAISFDDGPSQITDELLDYLEEQQLKVTFFLNGDNWNCIYRPESQRLLRKAYAAQHQIASHPWSHRDLESLSDEDIRQEMYRIEQAFRDILGVVPRYMRPPYGEHGERVRKVLEELGYVLVLWDVDQIVPASASSSLSSALGASGIAAAAAAEEEVAIAAAAAAGDSDSSRQLPMTGPRQGHTHQHREGSSLENDFRTSKWAEAVRGVSSWPTPLDREAMVVGGIYHEEATSLWAVEYVQSLVGVKIMPVAECLGEMDPRHWYKEVGKVGEGVRETCY